MLRSQPYNLVIGSKLELLALKYIKIHGFNLMLIKISINIFVNFNVIKKYWWRSPKEYI